MWPFNKKKSTGSPNWRSGLARKATVLEVGGFRPTGDLLASTFGEVRAGHDDLPWPHYDGKPLWPVCQLNLTDAPHVPQILSDLAMVQVFTAENYLEYSDVIVSSEDPSPNSVFAIRAFQRLDGLVPIPTPDHGAVFKPFEASWRSKSEDDFPTHDQLPFDFDNLGIGEYYDREGVDTLEGTKVGGWPFCIQGEPAWERLSSKERFEFAFQIGSENKAKCVWGDSGAVYVGRSTKVPERWFFDIQFY